MSSDASSFVHDFEPDTFDDMSEQADITHQGLQVKESIDRLINAGFAVDLNLPRLVVIGSQSSGKSSLFEGITGLRLPKDSGTCTRCPILCKTSRRDVPWRCRIKIERRFDKNEQPLPNTEIISFGPDIYDQGEVCDRISRAQAANLDPDTDHNYFLNATPYTTEGRFTANSVMVEVEGPDVLDLTFVDLPGIIAANPRGQTGVKEKVQSLATSYLENKACLILGVYHCDDDEENQGAMELAERYDPNGERTIVVLTKPDCIQDPVVANRWQDKLRASDTWFCVKQPGRREFNISWTEARAREMNYFRTGQWEEIYDDLSTRTRLGTENLRDYLSQRLLDWIIRRLPEVRKQVRKYLNETEASLSKFSPLQADPVIHMEKLLWEFEKKLNGVVDIYKYNAPPLLNDCRRRLEEFVRVLLYYLSPRFRPFIYTGTEDEENFEEIHLVPIQIPKLSKSITPPRPIYLDTVIAQSERYVTREMPGDYPYTLKKELMEASTLVWQSPTDDILEEIFLSVSRAAEEVVYEHFGAFRQTGLTTLVRKTVSTHLESRCNAVKKEVQISLQREKTNSLVFSQEEALDLKKRYLEEYRKHCPAHKTDWDSLGQAVRVFTKSPIMEGAGRARPEIRQAAEAIEIAGDMMDSLAGSQREPDPLSDTEEFALGVMATTRTFYHMATRRYAEGVAQIIFHDLLLEVQDGCELGIKLRKAIGIHGPDGTRRCNKFVGPTARERREREALESKRAILREFLDQVTQV